MTTATTTKTTSNRRAAASGPIRIPKSAVQAMPVVPDDNNNSKNTAAAAAAANAGMQNVNIASILNSTGPIVTAVLLKAGGTRKEKGDEHDADDDNVVEAVQVDTTPKKQMVAEILGGPFTFLGQYEEEGIVLMIRKDQDNHHHESDNNEGTKKHGLLERNQHPLQPPFQTSTVWGDILCLKVAPDDEDDAPEETEDAAMQVTITPKPNEEFFLNYTKEEYLKFAARTDVVYTPAPPPDDDEAAMDDDEEEEEETAIDGASAATNPPKLVEKVDSSDEEDDEGDAPYEMEEQGDQEDKDEEGDDDDEEDEEEGGFLDLLMGQVLQRFEQENGRMPDATELKALEAAITEKLGGMQ